MEQYIPIEMILNSTAENTPGPFIGSGKDSNCIRINHGDIFDRPYDAIVNPANVSLLRGSGLCGVIHRKAGPKLEEDCKLLGKQQYGAVVCTPAFKLAQHKYILHACGSRWIDGSRGEADQLAKTYANVINVAKEKQLGMIAVPAISTGIYGYPFDQASRVAIETVYPLLNDTNMRVVFVFPEEERFELFSKIVVNYLKSIKA